MAAAEIVCYIQPVTQSCEDAGMAWVDTRKTATLRTNVSSKRDALIAIEEARKTALSLGKMAIKISINSIPGERKPAGVKSLNGQCIVPLW